MPEQLKQRLDFLSGSAEKSGLFGGLRGIEREALRIDGQAALAQKPHPQSLGAALTHPHITTDYSEALLELITPPENSIGGLLASLNDIHSAVHAGLDGELLWSHSMPCPLPDECEIPIARYGASHLGKLKYVYRNGLALRYGKAMQCIAGIHYNFSVPDACWSLLAQSDNRGCSLEDLQSSGYMATLRNFHRYNWLLMVLFGASPACSSSFVQGRKQDLQHLSADTMFLPYATSLRMSDLGYQNSVQSQFAVSTDSLDCYVKGLREVVTQTHEPYEAFGTKVNGDWVQINPSILQIENEYYSTIRPKRVCLPGERPIQALSRRGVQYLEVRCMDIDPFAPAGIGEETAMFLDAFLYFCLLEESLLTSTGEHRENKNNFQLAVKQGRRPGLVLQQNGRPVELKAWATDLLDSIALVAEAMDAENGDSRFRNAVDMQRLKIMSPELTPSARVMRELEACNNSFTEFGLRQSRRHAEYFHAQRLSDEKAQQFKDMAKSSFEDQVRLEKADSGTFDEYIERFNLAINEDVHLADLAASCTAAGVGECIADTDPSAEAGCTCRVRD
jgi:glutamate--cysteine ligase